MSELQHKDDGHNNNFDQLNKHEKEELLIAAWLLEHPDFFRHQTDLVETLKVPHLLSDDSAQSVSLLEYQVVLLRKKNQQLQDYTDKLIRRARKNQMVIHQLHHLALVLMGADSLDQVIADSQALLQTEFKADVTALRLIAPDKSVVESPHFIQSNNKNLKHFNFLFEKHEAICGRIHPKQKNFLFGDDSKTIRSAVLVPLYELDVLGILALGSENEHRFSADMGIVFISQLGQLISKAILKQLENDDDF